MIKTANLENFWKSNGERNKRCLRLERGHVLWDPVAAELEC